MMDPRRKSAAIAPAPATSLRKRAAARTTAGRWSLLYNVPAPQAAPHLASETRFSQDAQAVTQAAIITARRTDAALDAHARILLCRYGVLFRELLTRESNAPKWRDLLPVLRRLEARGEIRGGRFVSGPFGEQYALSEAVDSLRKARGQNAARSSEAPMAVAAADPLNLAGVVVPGERVPCIPGREVRFLNGAAVEDSIAPDGAPRPARTARTRCIADILRSEAIPSRSAPASALPAVSPGLFR